MHTISADNAYAEPKARTVRLQVAVAVGAAAVTAAFGTGYVLSETLDEPSHATVAQPHIAHSFGAAATEALALKQRMGIGGRAEDIRNRRIR